MRGDLRANVFALFVGLSAFACTPQRGTIGAVLGQHSDGTLVVRDTPRGLAAERGGVLVGDEILLIEGRDVRGLRAEAVHQALAGEVGDPVKLTLIRGERVVRLTLTRTPARSGKAAPSRVE
ncbi:MAG TPA: PDZ domain-containing protein [Polyangiaceae bacterium]|nr:PDZ domain-containing protein [Polyangiaceae bacterium]